MPTCLGVPGHKFLTLQLLPLLGMGPGAPLPDFELAEQPRGAPLGW